MISSHSLIGVAPATRPDAGAKTAEYTSAEVAVPACEARIDEVVRQSFPASDPPSWNMGVANPDSWR